MSLTTEQLAAFHADLAKYQLTPADAISEINTGSSPGPTVLSDDPNLTDHPPSGWLMIKSIQDLKDQIGVSDADIKSGAVLDEQINYPPPASLPLS